MKVLNNLSINNRKMSQIFECFDLSFKVLPKKKKKTIPREMTAILVIELSNIRPPCREH